MREIKLKARAKINLTLDVTGKREDGYHLLQSIMQTVALYDGIHITRIYKNEIIINTNLSWLPTDERNLAYKAAKLLKDKFSIEEGVFIQIDKRIPVAAGLAGGSADCAAVLVGMNHLFSLGLSEKELEDIALLLGSDIPYCIRRGTALAEGIGADLTTLPPCPNCYVVLVKLPISVSTATVYQSLEWETVKNNPNTKGMLRAMGANDIETMGKLLGNVLEEVTISMHPNIQLVKNDLLALGGAGALMSGSGPTVFGLFVEEEKAKEAARVLRKKWKTKEVFVTTIFHETNIVRGDNTYDRD